jgi:putative sporulation protein YyaC
MNKESIMEFTFNLYNSMAADGAAVALKRILKNVSFPPIILCIGSDLSVGDSLGPLVGTLLKERLRGLNVYIYGTLSKPITAKEVKYMNEFLRSTHPQSQIIAIDAAVGEGCDIGLIKLVKCGLKPGSGANKKLAKVGDASIMGIVAEKTMFNYSLFSATRLNLVFKMAEIISDAVATFILDYLQSSNSISSSPATFKSVSKAM